MPKLHYELKRLDVLPDRLRGAAERAISAAQILVDRSPHKYGKFVVFDIVVRIKTMSSVEHEKLLLSRKKKPQPRLPPPDLSWFKPNFPEAPVHNDIED